MNNSPWWVNDPNSSPFPTPYQQHAPQPRIAPPMETPSTPPGYPYTKFAEDAQAMRNIMGPQYQGPGPLGAWGMYDMVRARAERDNVSFSTAANREFNGAMLAVFIIGLPFIVYHMAINLYQFAVELIEKF